MGRRDKGTARTAAFTCRIRPEVFARFQAVCEAWRMSQADLIEDLILALPETAPAPRIRIAVAMSREEPPPLRLATIGGEQ